MGLVTYPPPCEGNVRSGLGEMPCSISVRDGKPTGPIWGRDSIDRDVTPQSSVVTSPST